MQDEEAGETIPAEHAPPGLVAVKAAESRAAEATEVRGWIERLVNDGLDAGILTPGEDPRVSAEEIAILGRARWHLDEVIPSLRDVGVAVSVQLAGSGLFSSPAGRLAADGLAVVANERDRPALRRVTEELLGLGIEDLGSDGPLGVLATSGGGCPVARRT